jgi:hypothetical protein
LSATFEAPSLADSTPLAATPFTFSLASAKHDTTTNQFNLEFEIE